MPDKLEVSSTNSFGYYEAKRVALLLVLFAFFAFNGHFMTTVFLFVPRHRCKPAQPNDTNILNLFVSPESGNGINFISKCTMYSNTSNITVQCSEHLYDDSVGRTMVSEFNLVCDKGIYKSAILGVHLAITHITLVITGYIADRFGRKKAILVVIGSWSCLTCAASFIKSFWWFITLWIIAMSVGTAMVVLPFVLASELVSNRHRPLVNGLIELSYWIYGGIFPVVAYAARDWRLTARASGFIGVGLTALSLFCLDESHSWLLTVGRNIEANAVLHKKEGAGKITRSLTRQEPQIEQLIEKPVIAEQSRVTEGRFVQIISFPQLRRKLVILVIAQIGLNSILFGPPIGLQLIKLNPYYLFAVQNLAAAPMSVLVVFLIDRFGRVRPFVTLAFTSGISCVIGGSLPASQDVASGVVLGISRSLISGSYVIYYMLASEVLPTEIRSLAHSLIGLIAGLVSAGVPFLYQYLPDTLGIRFIPFLISGGILMVGSVLVLLFPETQKHAMVDYVVESEIVFPVNLKNASSNLGFKNPQPNCTPLTDLRSRDETPL